jgi:Tfp pilus assembly protein FimT
MTLVELAVILVILSILAVALYPSLGNVLKVTASKGAAEEVAGAVRLARQYAITRGSNHCIAFSGSPNTTFTIKTASTDSACDGGAIQPAQAIGHGLAVVSPTNLSIIFNGVGNVRNFAPGNPTVTLTVDTTPSTCANNVLVTLYGGVRVSQGTC